MEGCWVISRDLLRGDLGLASKYEGRVRLCFDAVERLIPASEVYLYGSYAQNKVTPFSKIRLLVLIGEGYSKREMKTLGWEVTDLVEQVSNEAFEVDVKVMSLSLYKQCVSQLPQMKMIEESKKDLRRVSWIDK